MKEKKLVKFSVSYFFDIKLMLYVSYANLQSENYMYNYRITSNIEHG